MSKGFDSSFFINNRQRLRELFTGTAPIVITANGVLQRNGDGEYPFRQDSSFWYLTGIQEPDIVLVIDKDKEYLIVHSREGARVAFDGAINTDELSAISGISEIYNQKDGWKKLGARLKRVKYVATIAPAKSYIEHYGLYTNPSKASLVSKIKEYKTETELLDLRPHIFRMRMVKQPVEIEAIQAAIDLTIDAFKKIQKSLEEYSYEYEIEADFTAFFKKNNATHAYNPIIANGASSCILHYMKNSARIDHSLPLLLDVGAEVNMYAADITRTWVEKPTKRQTQVAEAVKEVQDYAKSLLRPGVTIREYEGSIEHFMGEKLRELGLIQTIERETVRKYYPHAASHHLGLDVHDAADYELPFAAGMILTVEPGIYIPEEGLGVRIEDNVLITDKGIKVLSGDLPR